MEEIEEIHTRSLEWGCVCNLIDKIGGIEEKIDGHWDELLDMIADVINAEGQEKDPSKIFFYVYEFFWRLYYRLRSNPTRRKFNQVRKETHSGEEVYWITNYDYKTFKWAMQLARTGGYTDEINNDWIKIPADKLTTNQRRALDRRLGD